MKETVAILGGGHGAHAMAADLVSRGFSVKLYEMPQFIANLQRLVDTRVIVSSGAISGRFALDKVTSDIADAIDGVRYILGREPGHHVVELAARVHQYVLEDRRHSSRRRAGSGRTTACRSCACDGGRLRRAGRDRARRARTRCWRPMPRATDRRRRSQWRASFAAVRVCPRRGPDPCSYGSDGRSGCGRRICGGGACRWRQHIDLPGATDTVRTRQFAYVTLHSATGAPGRTRTSTSLRKADFESAASTNSATGAAPGSNAARQAGQATPGAASVRR